MEETVQKLSKKSYKSVCQFKKLLKTLIKSSIRKNSKKLGETERDFEKLKETLRNSKKL